ncbi:MAG: hypothetical protein NTW86_22610 [Candidatus Sumerlaeota bacterium]|nr:hypothetical protein [Candidatus Sumerlaeota bacterium]
MITPKQRIEEKRILDEIQAPYSRLALSLIECGVSHDAAIRQAAAKCPSGKIAFDKLTRLEVAAAAARKQ